MAKSYPTLETTTLMMAVTQWRKDRVSSTYRAPKKIHRRVFSAYTLLIMKAVVLCGVRRFAFCFNKSEIGLEERIRKQLISLSCEYPDLELLFFPHSLPYGQIGAIRYEFVTRLGFWDPIKKRGLQNYIMLDHDINMLYWSKKQNTECGKIREPKEIGEVLKMLAEFAWDSSSGISATTTWRVDSRRTGIFFHAVGSRVTYNPTAGSKDDRVLEKEALEFGGIASPAPRSIRQEPRSPLERGVLCSHHITSQPLPFKEAYVKYRANVGKPHPFRPWVGISHEERKRRAMVMANLVKKSPTSAKIQRLAEQYLVTIGYIRRATRRHCPEVKLPINSKYEKSGLTSAIRTQLQTPPPVLAEQFGVPYNRVYNIIRRQGLQGARPRAKRRFYRFPEATKLPDFTILGVV